MTEFTCVIFMQKYPINHDGYFAYDEYYVCYICPNNEILKYSTTNCEGYKEYKSTPEKCIDCALLK